MTDIVFPEIDDGDPTAAGVVATWYVADGEQVAADQLIADVQVEKIDAEVIAHTSGTVRLLVSEEQEVRQGTAIARIE